MIIRKKFKISLILFCVFFTVLAGCSKPFYKTEKQEKEDARKYFEEKLAQKAIELQLKIEEAEKELSKNREIIGKKASLEKKIKEEETKMKAYKDKLDEITGQINIFTATDRVARIRGRNDAHHVTSSAPPSPPALFSYIVPYEGKTAETEEYEYIEENDFLTVKGNPLSTFSIDVDAASYANARRFINSNRLPPKDAVRTEELINYFDYDYPEPNGGKPFSIYTEVSYCPWNFENKLVHIGLKGSSISKENANPSNLVFLIDVSGSMKSSVKLPLLKNSFKLLVNSLDRSDRISIVVYAGAAGLVLPPTPGDNKPAILEAIAKLNAGGSTAGGAGIKLAYKIAKENFIKGGNNRVILATDGDFNVGVSSTSEMVRMIEEKRKDGIFITVLGFGMGNYKDHKMEQIADKGNGNYYYIDSILEAKKVLVTELTGTLYTIAKDVKIQVEFNPAIIKAYRLIGYENRKLKNQDFKDDKKDAGELGSGHTVTALYEIIPYDSKAELPETDELKYQATVIKAKSFQINEMMTVKLRYKEPDEDESKLIENIIIDSDKPFKQSSNNFRFSAAVTEFSMMLRDSKFKGNSSYGQIIELARNSSGDDKYGYRAEFVKLVKKCELIK